MQSRTTQRIMFPPPPLTIAGVFKSFKEIATTEGKSSQVCPGPLQRCACTRYGLDQ